MIFFSPDKRPLPISHKPQVTEKEIENQINVAWRELTAQINKCNRHDNMLYYLNMMDVLFPIMTNIHRTLPVLIKLPVERTSFLALIGRDLPQILSNFDALCMLHPRTYTLQFRPSKQMMFAVSSIVMRKTKMTDEEKGIWKHMHIVEGEMNRIQKAMSSYIIQDTDAHGRYLEDKFRSSELELS